MKITGNREWIATNDIDNRGKIVKAGEPIEIESDRVRQAFERSGEIKRVPGERVTASVAKTAQPPRGKTNE